MATLASVKAKIQAALDEAQAVDSSPPAPPPPVLAKSWSLWDGASGTTGTMFNKGASLPWQNKGGDWLDADGVAQGGRPFATLKPTAAGVLSFDVTPLARKRAMIFVAARGTTIDVCRREYADPTKRPVLTVTLPDGSVVACECLASGVTNQSTINGVTGQTSGLTTGCNLCLQFAVPAGDIAKAVLTLTATKIWSGALPTLDIYELLPPQASAVAPTLGLADRYPLDAEIASDPDVYFASSLADQAQRLAEFPESYLVNGTVESVPEDGVSTLSVAYQVGQFTPMVLDHRWSQKKGVGHTRGASGLIEFEEIAPADYLAQQHPATPRDLYFRYYIKLRAGYQCSVDGKKLPGLAGRYGKWNTMGYYQPTAGNGGSPTTGLNSSTDGLSGWSMRFVALAAPTDANPYAKHTPLVVYAYHAAMAGNYGDNWRVGASLLEPDRWYCIEQHVRLNTVSGPFDALGNGVGAADGVLEVWVDGVRVLAKTDVLYRKHPAIGIDEVWLDHYHGGTNPPEAAHAFAMGGVVVARNYIGPMRSAMNNQILCGLSRGLTAAPTPTPPGTPDVPSWVPAAGTVASVSASFANTFHSVVPSYYSTAGSDKVITDFSSRVGNPDFGTYGAMLCHGGGHSATNDNGVYALELQASALQWKRLSTPYNFGAGGDTTNQSALTDDTTGEYPDGQPCAFHSYDLLTIRRAANGGASNGSLITVMRTACGVAGTQPNDVRAAHVMPFTDTVGPHAFSRLYGSGGAASPGSSCAYDPSRNRVWFTNAANATNTKIEWFDLGTNTYGSTNYTGSARPTSAGAVDGGCLRYDAVHDVLIHSASNTSGVVSLAYMACSNAAAGWTTISNSITGYTNGASVPFDYCSDSGKWYLISRGDLTHIYEITIPATITDAWTVTAVAQSGASLPTWYVAGRAWSYFPAAKCFLMLASPTNVYAFRPSGV